MLFAVLGLLAATPVSLNVDLSRDTTARLGPRVRELIEARLFEEGFSVEPGAKLKLGVEELHGTLRLWVKAFGHEDSSELRPAAEWPAELGFELAQRLAVLAHEAQVFVREEPAPIEAPPVAEPPPPEEEPRPPAPTEPPRENRLRFGAAVGVGVLLRVPSFDPELWVQGTLPTGSVEPVLSMGLVYAPSPGFGAWELPIVAGARLPIRFDPWSITPYLLIGGRLHLYGATQFDPAGSRLDLIGMGGVSVMRAIGPVRLGLRLGVEFAPAREHVQGDVVLWGRSGVGYSATLQVDR